MRRLFRKILEILDGTPAEYGKKRQAGQSLIEMAFISPILIILIVGMAEVGWLANNFLILQEVTRVGARRGTVLVGDTGPLVWNNAGSLFPRTAWPEEEQAEFTPFDPATDESVRRSTRNCPPPQELLGFYNLISCTVQISMDPLPFRSGIDPDKDNPAEWPNVRDRYYVDDLVISAFALAAIETNVDITNANFVANNPPGKWIHVVGRYPTNANECNVNTAGNVMPTPPERDPFDYIEDGGPTCDYCGPDEPIWLELDGLDPYNLPEYQRGFVVLGQHKVEVDQWNPTPVNCLGSQWTIERVEQLMNLPGFNLSDEQREFLPNQGMALVEIFWRHELYFDLPFFLPIYNMFSEDQTTLTTWSAFPAPGAEPLINYGP